MRRLKVEFPDPPGVVKPVCSSDSELKVVSTITVANFNPKQSYVAVPKGRKPVRRLVQVRCFGSRQPITRPSINSPVRSFRRPSAVLRHGNTGTGTAADIGADVILA
jgi:hypothetical protein